MNWTKTTTTIQNNPLDSYTSPSPYVHPAVRLLRLWAVFSGNVEDRERGFGRMCKLGAMILGCGKWNGFGNPIVGNARVCC
jgi:hypothetical protein